ncbi:MAG: holo-ACP synthase [Actinobacteria bacterium]|nr:holo-ACP synthase [Actinomycetota bacterium]
MSHRLQGTVVLGIGTDVLSVQRMRSCIDSPAFVNNTFTEAEVEMGVSRGDPAAYYAKVFAGKEAVFKCFGMEADALRSWTEIEIVDGGQGQPVVRLRGQLEALAEAREVREVLISLSYDTDYAVGFAMLTGEAGHGD